MRRNTSSLSLHRSLIFSKSFLIETSSSFVVDRLNVMKRMEEVDGFVGVCCDVFGGVVVWVLVCVGVVKVFGETLLIIHDGDATALV